MEQFPLLIKFIDAKKDLSIQVHPSDEYALKHEGQYGKTEVWYIMDCRPGAFIYYGFKEGISSEEFARRIQDKTLLEVLNKVEFQCYLSRLRLWPGRNGWKNKRKNVRRCR